MTTTMAPQTTGTMKALVQEGDGSADVLHLRDIPRPALAADRVLIKVRAASVNALDWHSVHGGRIVTIASKLMRSKEQPVRGVDVAGDVEAVGPNVTQFRPGDEVFGNAPASFAEYASGHKDGLALKPANVSFEQAAAVGVAGRTALQGLRDVAGVPGQRVLIHGAGGGVGTFAVQIAKALGAHVTAVTGPTKVDIIRSLGADEVIDYSTEDFTRRPGRFDVVFDVAATLRSARSARAGAGRRARARRRIQTGRRRDLPAHPRCTRSFTCVQAAGQVLRREARSAGPSFSQRAPRVRAVDTADRPHLFAERRRGGRALPGHWAGSSEGRHHHELTGCPVHRSRSGPGRGWHGTPAT